MTQKISSAEKVLIALSRTNKLLHREQGEIFREFDLTHTQFAILEVLWHKGPLCVKDIQSAILSTAGNVPLVIRNLEKMGYIKRRPGEKDRRLSYIYLTNSGEQLIQKVYPKQKENLEKLLINVSDADRRTLLEILIPLQRELKNKRRNEE